MTRKNETVTINGKKYLKSNIIAKITPLSEYFDPPIAIGQRFKGGLSSKGYILAQVETDKVKLISLEDGNRWNNTAIKVKNVCNISQMEWKKIIGNDEFIRIEDGQK